MLSVFAVVSLFGSSKRRDTGISGNALVAVKDLYHDQMAQEYLYVHKKEAL